MVGNILGWPLFMRPGMFASSNDRHYWSQPMSTTSASAASSAKEAAESKAESVASAVQSELRSLQEDVSRLASQLAEATAAKGEEVWRRARSSGADAADTLRNASSDVVDSVDESIRARPYMSIALALGLGFILGATWRR
jgi:ElaB/YqjD/DUF883 family membrane-anchored ribosome-binding protein